jgi:hypothetical protein
MKGCGKTGSIAGLVGHHPGKVGFGSPDLTELFAGGRRWLLCCPMVSKRSG